MLKKIFSAGDGGVMTGALAAKTLISLVLVALCGAAPTAGPSQDELSKAQVTITHIKLFVQILHNVLLLLNLLKREQHSVFL